MPFLFLTQDQAATIREALAPYFIGREGEVLTSTSDVVGKAVYDSVQIDIQNLYDFDADLQSVNGAGLVGIADLAGNFTSTDVEGAIVELFNGKLSSSAVSAYGLTLVAAANASAARTVLGLGTAATSASTDFQAADADLAAIAGLTFAADRSVYWTAPGVAATYTLTSTGRALAGATGAAAARTAIGAGVGSVTSVAATGSTGLTIGGSPITGAGTITFTLSTNLQSWSGVAPSSKADDSAVVKLSGTQTVAGAKTFSDIVTTSQYFQADGSTAGYRHQDRTNSSDNWVIYVTGGSWRVFSPNNEDVILLDKTNGILSDKFGRLRSVPLTTQNGNYTFTATDAGRGRVKNNTTAYSYTVDNNVHTAGDVLTALNDNSTANITIVQGTGVTLYLAGTTTTGNRTVAPRGYATIFMASPSVGYVSGPGVS